MSTNTLHLVKKLKDAGQDFEFYPTTPEIIENASRWIGEGESLLDVGAGRGDVLQALKKKAGDLYAIEKSEILTGQLPAGIFVVGSDFHRQTLIDKSVDIVFSNPPFSEFEAWAVKIIREAHAKRVLLVLPERWESSSRIKQAIADREADARAVGTFSFLEADRKARGKVNLVKIDLDQAGYYGQKVCKVDPFTLWFEKEFPAPEPDVKAEEEEEETRRTELATGKNIIEMLEAHYIKELGEIVETFRSIGAIPPALLKEIGVERKAVMGSLQSKIDGLKNKYWKELFDNLDKLTDRLTAKSRKALLHTLYKNTHIDFSSQNAYAVIIWSIKNANGYMDGQLTDLYEDLTEQSACVAYKSNHRFKDLNWRYCWRPEGLSHYKLDYRIVSTHFNAFGGYSFELDRFSGINESATIKVNDICTVAKTLGFDVMESARSFKWAPGKENVFNYIEGDWPEEFMRIRLYKNGNAHIKFNKDFMLKLNIEAARILGWIRSAGQAATEMQEKLEKVETCFKASIRIPLNGALLLENPKEK